MPPEIICTRPFPAAPAVRDRPILFSAPMVRALLDGTKTQTRRVVKPQPIAVDPRECRLPALHRNGDCVWRDKDGGTTISCKPHGPDGWAAENSPYGQPGDRLWVREAWAPRPLDPVKECVVAAYRATDDACNGPWKPSIHMPRWASRILLEVTDVRVERLQDISEADAIAEGIERSPSMGMPGAFQWCDYRIPHDAAEWFNSPIHSYETLWNQINGAGAWAANPWVWAYSFRRVPPTGGISETPPGGSTA